MSFEGLLNHTMRIWRRTVTHGALREEKVLYVPQAVVKSGVYRPDAPIGNPGPGLTPVGDRIVLALPEADIRERDVLEFLTGPDAPETLEVDSPVTRPRGHHVHANCRFWTGVLPVLVES